MRSRLERSAVRVRAGGGGGAFSDEGKDWGELTEGEIL